jgi:hypothetical protein
MNDRRKTEFYPRSTGSGCESPCCRLDPPTPRDLLRTFGQTLTHILIGLQISQHRLSQLTGLGADTVSRLVNDVRPATELQVLRICLGLRLPTNQANRLLEAGNFYPIPGDNTCHCAVTSTCPKTKEE